MSTTYFDGQTSKAHEAEVQIAEHDILDIRLPDGRRVSWLLSEEHIDWERTHDGLRIRCGDYPRQTLHVKDRALAGELVTVLKGVGKKDVHDSVLQTVRKAPLLVAFVLAGIVVLGYFFVLPGMAEKLAETMPLSADESLGDLVWNNLSHEYIMDENVEMSQHLQAFADGIDLSSDHELKLHFIQRDMINAFAFPGGHIVVFSGIIDQMDSPEELAALLAHEATHVQERHSTRMIMRQLAGAAFFSIMIGDVNGVLVAAAEHADQFRSMAYGRDLEREADRNGIENLVSNGIDPNGMVQLLELLDEGSGGIEEPEFISSHPLTSERIADAREFASEQRGLWSMSQDMRQNFEALQSGF